MLTVYSVYSVFSGAQVAPLLLAAAVISLVWLCVILAVLATTEDQPRLVLPAAVVLLVGGLSAAAGQLVVPLPAEWWLDLALCALAVAGGGPAAALVLRAATRGGATGVNGGILVGDEPGREVLRGGTTIGYLERIVVVAAALLGRWELLAALIAVKGLGRFRDLDAGAATERFIIGTLVSLIWAGAAALLIAIG